MAWKNLAEDIAEELSDVRMTLEDRGWHHMPRSRESSDRQCLNNDTKARRRAKARSGICRDCPANAVPGRVRCEQCAAKSRESYARWAASNADAIRAKDKRIKDERVSLGLCVSCGAEKAVHGQTCGRCYGAKIDRQKRCRAQKRQGAQAPSEQVPLSQSVPT